MLIFNNLEEMKAYYVEETNTYVFKDDVTINFPLSICAHIDALNITAWDIRAWDIRAGDITTGDITAWDIRAGDIYAEYIDAGHIDAENISYWAICIAHYSFKCKSVKGRRDNSIHKCLDQEIEFVKD